MHFPAVKFLIPLLAAGMLLTPLCASADTQLCECLRHQECLPPPRALVLCNFGGEERQFTRESMLSKDERIEELLVQFRTGNSAARTTAITDLGTLGPLNTHSMTVVLRALSSDESKWVRRAAARTLGRLQMGGTESALRVALGDNDKWVSHSASEALRKMRSSADEPAL